MDFVYANPVILGLIKHTKANQRLPKCHRWAKKQNLPNKQMKKIENLCLRAINLFSHQVEYRPEPHLRPICISEKIEYILFIELKQCYNYYV